MTLTFKEYQQGAVKTAIYPAEAKLYYPALGLAGEAGEVAEKVKKIIRDKGGVLSIQDRAEIGKEVGDVLWYLSALCNDLGIHLGDMAQVNLDKLRDRQERGVIGGSGDNR